MCSVSACPVANSGVKPVEMTLMSPGHWFVDFGTEMMAGLTVTVTGGKAGAQMNVRLSEELLCNGCNESHAGGGGPNTGKGCNTCNYNDTRKAILFPMRTGNTYEEIWTMNEGVSVFENHEYKLFRYNPDRSPRPGVFVFVAGWHCTCLCVACVDFDSICLGVPLAAQTGTVRSR